VHNFGFEIRQKSFVGLVETLHLLSLMQRRISTFRRSVWMYEIMTCITG